MLKSVSTEGVNKKTSAFILTFWNKCLYIQSFSGSVIIMHIKKKVKQQKKSQFNPSVLGKL